MIFFLVTAEHQYTVAPYAQSWLQSPTLRVHPVPYAALPLNASLPTGTYVFSDLERLNAVQRSLVARLWEQLAAAGDAVRLLNHPERSLRRYGLLRMLHERGLNRFNVFRPSEPNQPW